MSNCTIKFTIGGTKEREFVFEGFDSIEDSSIEQILSYIEEKVSNSKEDRQNWENFISKLLSEDNSEINLQEVIDKGGQLVPNTSSEKLFGKNDQLGDNVDVLLVRDIRSLADKNLSFGTILKQNNGRRLFIVKYKEEGLLHNYLKIQEQLKSYDPDEEEQAKNEAILKTVNESKGTKNFKDFKDLVIDFIQHKSKYSKSLVEVYKYLSDFCNNLLGYNQVTSFNNDQLNALFRVSSIIKSFSTDKKFGQQRSIKINDLYYVLKNIKSDIFTLNKETLKDLKTFKEYYSKPLNQILNDNPELRQQLDLTDNLVNKYKNIPLYALIIQKIIDSDPNFEYQISKITDNYVNISQTFENFENKFGFAFDTIQQFVVEDYFKDYGIFRYNGKYYVSKYVINEDISAVKEFDSLDAAKAYINLNSTKRTIADDLIIFKKLYNLNPEEKLIIPSKHQNKIQRVPKLPEGITEFNLTTLEKNFINDKYSTVHDFFNSFIFKNWKGLNRGDQLVNDMKTVLTSPEKILIFMYLTNEGQDNFKNVDNIRPALNRMMSLEYQFVKPLNSNNILKLDVVNKVDQVQHISDFYSTSHALELLKYKLGPKININIMTSDQIIKELKDTMPEIKDIINSVKGFVHNDKIYINSDNADLSDMAHEYMHVVLSIFKANKDYYQFLDKFREIVQNDPRVKEIYNTLKSKDESNPYRNFSDYDILEETLARCFGEHIKKGNIFTDDSLVNELYVSDVKFKDILNSSNLTLEELIKLLKVDSSNNNYLENLFPTKSRSYYIGRKVTRFIEKEIRNENIKEVCD